MDYGHTAQNQSGEPSFFTAGVGNSPVNATLPGDSNLVSGAFLPEQDYSGRGNVALRSSSEMGSPLPLPDSDPSHAAATATNHGSEASITDYSASSANPETKLGEIQDAPGASSNSSNEDTTAIPDSIKKVIESLADGKASPKDAKKLEDEIRYLMNNEENSNNATELVDLWDASCEAMNKAGGSK